jgi:hypothetical protein
MNIKITPARICIPIDTRMSTYGPYNRTARVMVTNRVYVYVRSSRILKTTHMLVYSNHVCTCIILKGHLEPFMYEYMRIRCYRLV